jgi:hypothetical protein
VNGKANGRNLKTVFVVGAGASREVGLPTGSELIDLVANKLNYEFHGPSLRSDIGDHEILDVIQQYAPDRATLDLYLAAARRVREGILFSNSIDTFIDVHRRNKKLQFCGKLAIVKTILEAERASAIYVENPNGPFADVQALSATWFVRLARGLTDGVRKSDLKKLFRKVSFVVFDYDRCIEHFLYNVVQKHYGTSENDARFHIKSAKDFSSIWHHRRSTVAGKGRSSVRFSSEPI